MSTREELHAASNVNSEQITLILDDVRCGAVAHSIHVHEALFNRRVTGNSNHVMFPLFLWIVIQLGPEAIDT